MAPGKKDTSEGHEMLDLMPVKKEGSSANVVCVIKNYTESANEIIRNLSDDTNMVTFYDIVAEGANYVRDSFLLTFSKPCSDGQTCEDILLDDKSNVTLRDIVGDKPGRRSYFLIKSRNGKEPIKRIQCPSEDAENDSPEVGLKSLFDIETSFSTNSTDASGKSSMFAKAESGFVGLVNQAMTCYLNSLLQTLFMTPEFRNALYKWRFRGTSTEASRSIPFQLQKLFIKLQTSKKRAVETTDLTKSFGWDSSEAWQQHDVQELCQVMFDALEEKLKDTDQADIINQLYQGKMKDYVRCLKCENESARIDSYLDIPLAIRPFGSKESHSSIEEAFRAFTTPETLDGNNQYFCEKCKSKQDAHKGLKFLSFPSLLTIQLKRFTFDYNTGQRIKLHNRVTFPDIFKLNEFVHQEEDEKEIKEKYDDECDKKCQSVVQEERGPEENGSVPNGSPKEEDHFNPNDETKVNSEKEAEHDKEAPDVYELFSILIHSGTALGGHYYAYIKSFKNNQWYCFNDQAVSMISKKDIEKSFGGLDPNSRGYYSATYSSSTNAYMLMYRRKDRARKAVFMDPEKWPEHIKAESERMDQEEEDEIRRKAEDRNLCKLKLFCNHPATGKWIEEKLHVNQNKSLQDTTEIAWKLLNLDNLVELQQCRLVKYDDHYGSYERSYEGEENKPIGALVRGLRYSSDNGLLLETKKLGDKFQVYEQGGVTIQVHNVDLDEMRVHTPQVVYASSDSTLSDLKKVIQDRLGYSTSNMRLAVGRDRQEFMLLNEPKKSLKLLGFYKMAKVYIEVSGGSDAKIKFADSKFARVLEKHVNTININVTLPLIDPEAKREVTIKIDKRSSVADLKEQIETHARVPACDFRIYKVYQNEQEFEVTNLSDQLTTYSEETKMIARLGRALKPGETRIKVYFLRPNHEEVSKFLMEPVISNQMSIKELKSQVITELRKTFNIDHPIERLRLRKKSWKNPVTIYTDDFIFHKDIDVTCSLELFAEIVCEDLQLESKDILSIYVKRWRRSKHVVDDFEEILLSTKSLSEVKSKISALSGIPEENVEIAKGKGYFPYASGVFEIEKELDWNPRVERLCDYPLAICDDGSVLYYRDKEEEIEKLTEDRRIEIREKERKRIQKNNSVVSFSRKEKPLKIYT
eukprot:gene12688-13990_t